MFTPKTGTNLPSSASGRALASGSRRRTSVGGLAGSPFGVGGSRSNARSPFANPSGRNTPTLGTPGTALGQQSQYCIETYGNALPALVKEALTFSEKSSEMSVVLSSCGWAWLVTGRRLLVWRFTNDGHLPLAGTPMSRSGRGGHATEFRELLLPQSDLAHRAQLVVLRQPDSSQLPSCMAVSPEGNVRYWHSIAHESSYAEITTELQGQECDSLLYLSSRLGYFLATTTSTCLLLLPTPAPHSSQPEVSVRLVKAPAGLLGGLSRRVTSLMFGSLPTQSPEARLVRVVCRSSSAGGVEVLVVSAEHLQCWHLSPGSSSDSLVYQAPLLQLVRQALAAKMQAGLGAAGGTGARGPACGGGGVWLLDAQPQPHAPSQLVVLVAALHPARGSELTLALAVVESGSCPQGVLSTTLLQQSDVPPSLDPPSSSGGVSDDSAPPAPLLQYRLVLASCTAFVHTPSSVIAVPCSDATIALSVRVALPAPGDRLLGTGRLKGHALFFTASQGVLAVTPPGGAAPTGDLQLQSLSEEAGAREGLEVSLRASPSSSGAAARLQEAFMLYNRDETLAAQGVLEETFPQGSYQELPDAALALSRKLLDDTPATDPRWAEAGGVGGGGGTTHSLIITNQIRDKMTAHKFYLNFLHQTGLWGQLGLLGSSGDQARKTLQEDTQRLAFAAALRARHQQHQQLVDHAIAEVVRERGDVVTGRLTAADLFYWRVSAVHDIVWGLSRALQQVVDADVAPRDAPGTLHTTASLVLALVRAATAGGRPAPPSISSSPPTEYVPWTASGGPRGLRTLLIALHRNIVEVGIGQAADAASRASLYASLVDLADVILAGYQPQLTSLLRPADTAASTARYDAGFGGGGAAKHLREGASGGAAPPLDAGCSYAPERYQILVKEYEILRYSLIQPLVRGAQYPQALSLAEKYCDYRVLVEVCDAMEDTQRLHGYMEHFSDQGFSDFVFRWFLETGKRGRLLSYGRGGGGPEGGEWAAQLATFLKGYAGLEWLHQLGSRDFAAAHESLKQQALAETAYLARKKTLVSLSKLCGMVASAKDAQDDEDDEDVTQPCTDQDLPTPDHARHTRDDVGEDEPDLLRAEEELILYQEQLPQQVLAAHNLSPDTMRVLSPAHMIELYTSEDNVCATELDFKKALELLSFVPRLEECEALKLSIWVRAALRDSWHSLSTDAPLDAISGTLLFRTVELAYSQGCDLRDLLVPVEDLLAAEDLQPLARDAGFCFLVRAGYEKLTLLTA